MMGKGYKEKKERERERGRKRERKKKRNICCGIGILWRKRLFCMPLWLICTIIAVRVISRDNAGIEKPALSTEFTCTQRDVSSLYSRKLCKVSSSILAFIISHSDKSRQQLFSVSPFSFSINTVSLYEEKEPTSVQCTRNDIYTSVFTVSLRYSPDRNIA